MLVGPWAHGPMTISLEVFESVKERHTAWFSFQGTGRECLSRFLDMDSLVQFGTLLGMSPHPPMQGHRGSGLPATCQESSHLSPHQEPPWGRKSPKDKRWESGLVVKKHLTQFQRRCMWEHLSLGVGFGETGLEVKNSVAGWATRWKSRLRSQSCRLWAV